MSKNLLTTPYMGIMTRGNDDHRHRIVRFGNHHVFMYFDEAGDFDHSKKGSRYFMLVCSVMVQPFACANSLIDMRRKLLADGTDIEYFHASNDHKWLRKQVFEEIGTHATEFAVYYAAIDKQGDDFSNMPAGDIYCRLFDEIFNCVLDDYDLSAAKKIIAITDNLPTEVRKKSYKHRMKAFLSNNVGIEYQIYHHHSMSDTNLQITDYCCWALQRYMERNDFEAKSKLKDAVRGGIIVGKTFAFDREKSRSRSDRTTPRPSQLSN